MSTSYDIFSVSILKKFKYSVVYKKRAKVHINVYYLPCVMWKLDTIEAHRMHVMII